MLSIHHLPPYQFAAGDGFALFFLLDGGPWLGETCVVVVGLVRWCVVVGLVMCITLARKMRVVVVGREGVFLCWIRAGLGCGGGAWMVGRCNILNIKTALRLWSMGGKCVWGVGKCSTACYIYRYADMYRIYTHKYFVYRYTHVLCEAVTVLTGAGMH